MWVIGNEIPVTRLRKMMLEELQRRNYSAITTRNYLRVVSYFAKHFGESPDTPISANVKDETVENRA
jgi:hypothetical protein